MLKNVGEGKTEAEPGMRQAMNISGGRPNH
jgi:hypothetical protein